jgi:hypothetical protein
MMQWALAWLRPVSARFDVFYTNVAVLVVATDGRTAGDLTGCLLR